MPLVVKARNAAWLIIRLEQIDAKYIKRIGSSPASVSRRNMQIDSKAHGVNRPRGVQDKLLREPPRHVGSQRANGSMIPSWFHGLGLTVTANYGCRFSA
jgi:hypothetical protein